MNTYSKSTIKTLKVGEKCSKLTTTTTTVERLPCFARVSKL